MPAAGIALGTARGGAPRPDPDALAFAATSGATDIAALSKFVKAVKDLGLWSNMVCWPLRSSQNAGTGNTAYSLGGLGTYNGTLVNGPVWGANGITISASNRRITSSFNFATALPSILFVVSPASAAQGTDNNGGRFMSNDTPGSAFGIGVDDFAVDAFRLISAAFTYFAGTRSANTRTMFGHGNGTNNTFWFQDGSRTAQSNTAYNASTRTLSPVGPGDAGVPTSHGVYSCSVAFDGVAMSSTLLSNFYTVYKQTLGVGLGLP